MLEFAIIQQVEGDPKWFTTIQQAGENAFHFSSDSAAVAFERLSYVLIRLDLIDFPPWDICHPEDSRLDDHA